MSENKQFLYRYRPLNGQHREWTKKILTDSVLHFANPSTFNDPFDGRVHYLPSFSVEELKKQHVDRIKKRVPDLNRKQRRTRVIQDIKAVKPEKFLSQITLRLQSAINGMESYLSQPQTATFCCGPTMQKAIPGCVSSLQLQTGHHFSDALCQ